MKLRQIFITTFMIVLSLNTVRAADKTIGILVFDEVLTSDIIAPIEVFGVASKMSWFSDYDVVTININEKNIITTQEGLSIVADKNISDSLSLDVLIVPSRYDMKSLIENQELISFINQSAKRTTWLASNCSGSLLLAEAGLLDGKNATTWAGGEKEFQKSYPNVNVVEDQNFVIDGNILTSNGGVVSYQAALALLANLSSESKAKEVALAVQYQRIADLSGIILF